MDPRLRSLVIVLVGAAVGAVVAGGAISYVNSSAPPMGPSSSASLRPDTPPLSTGPDRGEAVANAAPASETSESSNVSEAAPAENGDTTSVRSSARGHLFDSSGPTATVTTDDGGKKSTSETPAGKKASPVVEEDAAPKTSDDDGGGVRDSGGKDGDGGSVR